MRRKHSVDYILIYQRCKASGGGGGGDINAASLMRMFIAFRLSRCSLVVKWGEREEEGR